MKLLVCCFVNSFVGVINVIWYFVLIVDNVVSVVIRVLFEFILFCIRCIIGCGCCIFCWILVIMCCWVLVGEKGKFFSSLLIKLLFMLMVIFGCVLFCCLIFSMFKCWVSNFFRIKCICVGCLLFFNCFIVMLGGGWWISFNVLVRFICWLYMLLGNKLFSVFLFSIVNVCLVRLCRVSCLMFLVVGYIGVRVFFSFLVLVLMSLNLGCIIFSFYLFVWILLK